MLIEPPLDLYQTARYNSMEKAYKGAQEEIESLKEKLARRVQRVDEMFLAHQKVTTQARNIKNIWNIRFFSSIHTLDLE